MKYAATTSVSVEKSRAEIEAIVRKYGATEFASGWSSGRAMIGFEMRKRQIRFVLTLAVKAKLEAVECGISEFDHEFMANIVMPDGMTIGEHVLPRLEAVLSGSPMPPLLGYVPPKQ